MTLYSIIADGTFDQVVESREDRAREVADLRGMGHRVKTVSHDSWDAHYDWLERMNQ